MHLTSLRNRPGNPRRKGRSRACSYLTRIPLVLICACPSLLLAQVEAATSAEAPQTSAPPAEAPPRTTGEIFGRVLEAGTRDPLEDVAVLVEGTDIEVYTDFDGRFELPDLPPGKLKIKLAFPRYEGKVAEEVVEAGNRSTPIYYLRPRDGSVRFAMEVVSEADKKEVVKYELSLAELKSIPGTYGDPVKAVQNLPGVARAPFGLGFLIVRGTGPNDTGTYIDGLRVPIIFHFGGLVSVFNGSILDKVEYMPGGFSARYGRNLGGVVDLSTHDYIPARMHGYGEVDLFNSSFYVQGAQGDKLAYSLSARRSYIDFLANPIIEATTGVQVRFPRYWDVQAKLDYQLSPQDTFQLMFFSSDDRFEILGTAADSADEDAAESAAFGTYVTQYKLKGRWRHQFGVDISQQLDIALGPEKQNLAFGAGEFKIEPFKVFLRDEVNWRALNTLQFRVGLDLQATLYDLKIIIPALEDVEGSEDVNIESTAFGISPSLYAEADWLIDEKLRVIPGLRVDPLWVYDNYQTLTVDPRLSFRAMVDKETVLKGNIGRYSQPPAPQQFFKALDNPDLLSEYAVQGSLGFERQLAPHIRLDMVGYYGEIKDRIVNGPGGGTFKLVSAAIVGDVSDEPAFVNDGLGRIYGFETLLRHDLTDKLFAWISYTLSRSERKEVDDTTWGLFNFDQTHILTVLGSYRLPRGWEASARFRYSSGLPYTPVINAYQDLDSGQWVGIQGEEDSARNPPFHSLDIRVQKEWRYDTWKLQGYLDIQNVYNRVNPESSFDNFDFTDRQVIQGLPILPVIGVRGDF